LPARLRPSASVGVLGAVAVVFAVVLAYFGLRNFLWQPDELLFVQLGRYVGAHFPSALWASGVYERGPQRLTVWILAGLQWLFDAPTALQIGRVLQAAFFVTVAVPTYALARGVGLTRAEAAVPAALAMLVPWAVVGTTFLTESLAYPLAACTMLAAWRTTVAPSPRRDLVAIAALVLAVLAKTSLAALAPILVIAPLAQALRFAPDDVRPRWRSFPSRLWSEHAVLVVASALVVVAFVARIVIHRGTGVSSSLFGVYGSPSGVNGHILLHQSQILLARLVVGTGIVPACLALAWLARTLIRPASPGDHALAVIALATTAILVLVTALIWGDDRAGVDERYVMYLAVPLFVMAARAVVGWTVGTLAVAASAVAVILLVAQTSWQVDVASGVRSLTYPAEAFFGRVIVGRLRLHEPDRLLGHEPLLAALLAGVVAVALVALGRRLSGAGRGALVGTATAIIVVAVQLALTGYTLSDWDSAQGTPPGWSKRAWVDGADHGSEPVAVLGLGYANGPDYASIWDEVRFYNTDVDPVVKARDGSAPAPPTAPKTYVSVRPADGLVVSTGMLPRLAVTGHDLRTLGLSLQHVRDAGYLDAQLVRLPRPLRADWLFTRGVYPDGFLEPTGPATLRGFTAGVRAGQRACLRLSLTGPPGYAGAWRYDVVGGRRPVAGRVGAQRSNTVKIELVRGGARGHFRDVTIDAPNSVAYPDGRKVGLLATGVARVSC
jgi:hypothetical protein